MGRLKLITAPTSEPITLSNARKQLRVDPDGSPPTHPEDSIITRNIVTAREYIENRLERQLMPATWELTLDEFPLNEIKIPLPPLRSIVSVKYDDTDGVEQNVSLSNYNVDQASDLMTSWIVPISEFTWPSTIEAINAVRIRFDNGYADAASIPSSIIDAIYLMITDLYEHRGTISSMPSVNIINTLDRLLSNYEVRSFP